MFSELVKRNSRRSRRENGTRNTRAISNSCPSAPRIPVSTLVYSTGNTMRNEMNTASCRVLIQIRQMMMNDATGTDLMAVT